MKQIGKKYHKNLAAVIIILALSGAVILCHLTGILDYVEFKLYDLRINTLAGASPRSNDIIVVFLDQDSLDWAQKERGWGWPWPRAAYAELVNYMNLGGAKSVVFDVLFTEPSIYRNPRQDEIIERAVQRVQNTERTFQSDETPASGATGTAAAGTARERRDPGAARAEGVSSFRDIITDIRSLGERVDDSSFADAASNFGRVVHGVVFTSETGSMTSWPSDLNKPLFKPENFGSFLSVFSLGKNKQPLEFGQFPIREHRSAASVVASLTGISDKDNIIRRTRLFTLYDGKAVPGLSVAPLLASGYDGSISYDPAKRLIHWGEHRIPVDEEGMTLLRYRGKPDRYLYFGLSEILQSAEDYAAGREPLIPPDSFTGTYVFLGYNAQGLFDTFPTPIASVYPGVLVHVTMLDNLLMGDYIQKAPNWVAIMIIAASVILVVILVLFSGRIAITVAGLVGSIAVLVGSSFVTFYLGWWIPMATPLIAVFLAYLSATLYSYATEGKDKRFIKSAFSRIISPKVVDQIIGDPSQLKLGGEKRKMTAIFTDIQRFSSISSELQDEYGENGPKVLVNLLNLYLTEMSNVVIANGGTIDKYEGDAIIAFFGAPVWVEDHPARACRSAILMKRREKEIREMIMNPSGEFFKPLSKLIEGGALRENRPLYTRLGINSGDMVVGFMGTPGKMDYTIMGNAVNLAARLEGVNKQYDTRGILISEYTRDQIGDEFVVRRLSRVTVVGIPVPVRLYELFEIKSEASPELLESVKIWEGGFDAFEDRKFAEAGKIFKEVVQRDPEDLAARLYVKRCAKYVNSPPPATWNVVDNLTDK